MSLISAPIVHACCAALGEAGVLITGPSGSGKSDLLLRLIDAGFCLVADDRTRLDDGQASAPEALFGLIEVRGLGILEMPARRAPVRIHLHVDLSPMTPPPARLPEEERHAATGALTLRLDPRRASAVAIIRAALRSQAGEEWGDQKGGTTLRAGLNGATFPSLPFPSGEKIR